jgi:hypothetical protein
VSAGDLAALDAGAAERAREFEALFEEIVAANEPTVMPKDARGRLEDLLVRRTCDRRGRESTLLLPEEFRFLSIAQGSLSEDERRAVESHVSHTFHFLRTIPWTPDLARVPEIAFAHHERLDGTGYPRGLDRKDIPPAARALAVCDVYDALTASDRPYKKALPREAALDILEGEAKRDRLDSWMVSAFIEGKVWTSLAS